jgi:hypothetical protein
LCSRQQGEHLFSRKADNNLKTKEIYLKNIKQGDKVASTFLAAEKNMAFSLKGSPYLNVRLKDKTASSMARSGITRLN